MWPRGPSTRDIGIVCIGDSHTNGQLPIATVAASVVGPLAINGGKDKEWNGTSDNAAWLGLGYNNDSGKTDGMIGIDNTRPSFTMYLPSVLRKSSPRFGRIRLANLAAGGSSSYSWAATCATCYVSTDTNPQAGDTLTVGSVTYTFRASATLPNEITIGGTNLLTAINIGHAVSAEGTGFGAGTVPNPEAFCPSDRADKYTGLTSTKVGALGNNEILSTVSGGRISFMAQFSNGGTMGLFANATALVPAGFGQVDAVTITLGTNDASRPGWRGRGFQAHMNALCARIEAQWPTAKIIMWKPNVSGGGAAITTALTTTINPAVAAVVSANPSTRSFVDMYALGAGAGTGLILDSGGTHLTGYGYSIAAELFGGAIASALGMA